MLIGIDGNEANVAKRVGSGQYGFELLWHLNKLAKNDTFFVYLKNPPLSDLPPSSSHWSYRVFGPKKIWTQFALPLNLYFKKPRPDVFFTPTHYAPRFCPVPQVVTIFDLSYIHYPELFRKQDLYQLQNWSTYSIKKAKVILTISQSSKEDIINHYKVDSKKVVVTYPGYDKGLFKPVKDERQITQVKKKFSIKGDYIFFLGTIQPRKNLIKLLEAVGQLINNSAFSVKNFQLVIAGKKGWLYDEFFQKLDDPKLKNRVIVTDYVSDQDLPALFSGAKAFVLPSLWEGFGIPVVEAMACGCPVVVSKVSSLPEVVSEAGVLVDPMLTESIKEGIEKVIGNNTFAQDLAQKGLKRAQKFSWEKCAKETLQILQTTASASE